LNFEVHTFNIRRHCLA